MSLQVLPAAIGDRRQILRRDVQMAAKVRTPMSKWIDCTVTNVSAMGALLEFAEPVVLPGSLILQIPEHLLQLECVVRHMDGRKVGVLFTTNRQATVALFG